MDSGLNRSALEMVFTQNTEFILTTEILVAESFTRGAFSARSSSLVRIFSNYVTSKSKRIELKKLRSVL